MPDFSTLSRRQKGLNVAISFRPSTGALHLLIDSTGIKAEGDGERIPDRSSRSNSRFLLAMATSLYRVLRRPVETAQFTSFVWTDRLKRAGSRISMDGKGRCIDNVFIERLWRSLKYECVYLHAWETGSQAKAGVSQWITFYNYHRPHSSLGGIPPAVFYRRAINETQPDQQVQKVA